MQLRLIVVNIRILLCFFFLLLVLFSNFFIIPVVREKIKVEVALAIPAGAQTTLAKELVETAPLVALKTNKILSINQT